MWTVSRQRPYYLNLGSDKVVNIVEISQGDINYTGSDALVAVYDEEMCTFNSLVYAVEVAIRIRDQWNNDSNANAEIGIDNTLGMGLEIGPTAMNDDELKEYAVKWDNENLEEDEDWEDDEWYDEYDEDEDQWNEE
jgi:hypothetical protein